MICFVWYELSEIVFGKFLCCFIYLFIYLLFIKTLFTFAT